MWFIPGYRPQQNQSGRLAQKPHASSWRLDPFSRPSRAHLGGLMWRVRVGVDWVYVFPPLQGRMFIHLGNIGNAMTVYLSLFKILQSFPFSIVHNPNPNGLSGLVSSASAWLSSLHWCQPHWPFFLLISPLWAPLTPSAWRYFLLGGVHSHSLLRAHSPVVPISSRYFFSS